MWQQIVVAGQPFMACCTFADEQFQYILYDGADHEAFSETIAERELIQRAAQLNKRTRFPDATIHETLTTAAPVEAALDTTTEGDITLKLKYRVTDLPLRNTWHIKPMSSAALWQRVIAPMLATICTLSAQLDELRECIRKKDVEILQYKIEGAKLNRSTVATKSYDFELFDVQHKAQQMQAKGYQSIANYLGQCKSRLTTAELQAPPPTHAQKLKNEEEEQKCTSLSVARKPKLSPRNRKRKAMEFSKIHLQRKVLQKRQVQQLLYKDSQSQEDSQEEERDTKPSVASAVEHSTSTTELVSTPKIGSVREVQRKSTTPEQIKLEPLVYETSSEDEQNCEPTSTSGNISNKAPQHNKSEEQTSNSIQPSSMKSKPNRSWDCVLSSDDDEKVEPKTKEPKIITTIGPTLANQDSFDIDAELQAMKKTLDEMAQLKNFASI